MWNYERRLGREDFLKILPKNSTGVELGVFKGEFSKYILKIVKPKKLYLIDMWWQKFGIFYPDWGDFTNYGKLKTKEAYKEMTKNIRDFKEKCEILIGDDKELLLQFADEYFDWIYLDSSHYYEDTIVELDIIRKKIKPYGLITGHDWYSSPDHDHYGVCKAVTEFCTKTSWKIVYIDKQSQWCLMNSAVLTNTQLFNNKNVLNGPLLYGD